MFFYLLIVRLRRIILSKGLVFWGVTQKVSSNSKHTLLCLCGHNVLARIKPNTIENTAVVRPSGWRRKASKERLVFRYVQRMKQINPEELGT